MKTLCKGRGQHAHSSMRNENRGTQPVLVSMLTPRLQGSGHQSMERAVALDTLYSKRKCRKNRIRQESVFNLCLCCSFALEVPQR